MSQTQILDMESKDFEPLSKLLLVKTDKIITEEVSQSGVIVEIKQKSVLDRPYTGTVVAIGPEVKEIAIGDKVIWPIAEGLDFKLNDGNFTLLKIESVIGKNKA